jgi:hypothetical protein
MSEAFRNKKGGVRMTGGGLRVTAKRDKQAVITLNTNLYHAAPIKSSGVKQRI